MKLTIDQCRYHRDTYSSRPEARKSLSLSMLKSGYYSSKEERKIGELYPPTLARSHASTSVA